jgi:hypothetical protein
MDKLGKLRFLAVDGDHLHFSEEWFIDNIVNKYLRWNIQGQNTLLLLRIIRMNSLTLFMIYNLDFNLDLFKNTL